MDYMFLIRQQQVALNVACLISCNVFILAFKALCSDAILFSASLSGSLSTSNSSLSGFAGLQNLGNNNLAATSMSPGVTNGTSGIDALSQAYTGIQQYAGLSGLLSPSTGKWLIFTLQSSLFSVPGVQLGGWEISSLVVVECSVLPSLCYIDCYEFVSVL